MENQFKNPQSAISQIFFAVPVFLAIFLKYMIIFYHD